MIVGGPFLGIFGIFRYRAIIHRHLWKKNFQYSVIRINLNESLNIFIPLTKNKL